MAAHWTCRPLGRSVLFLSAAALPAAVYGLTLAPSLSWAHGGADGGELLAAAATGGIAHPPGFPTYLFLAGLVLQLPLGDMALRLNALSAAMAALASGLVALAICRRVRAPAPLPWLAGLAGGWLLALSPLVWSQAVITEVYTTALAVAAALLLLSRRHAPARTCLALGLLWGLGLGVHPTLLFFLPLLGYSLWPLERRRALCLGLGLLVGLVPYGLLPLRAAAGPALSWGDVTTPSGWWWLVSGAPYRGYFLGLPPEGWPLHWLGLLVLLVRALSPLGLPLAAYGWTRLWRTERARAVSEGIAVLALFAFSLAWGTADSSLYLLPALGVLAVWAGEAMASLSGRLWAASGGSKQAPSAAGGTSGRPREDLGGGRLAVAAMVLFLLLPLGLLGSGWAEADLHADESARLFLRTVLAQAPPRALLISQADRHTFALWAYRYALADTLAVEGGGPARSDFAVVDLDLLAFPWYRAGLAAELDLPALAGEGDPWAILQSAGRPLCTVSDAGLECDPPPLARQK